ncbi:putative transcription factor VIP1 [Iris pallida]|uniref:Transcription factor VIP1 n=1 Tax=Iris pallida TaxID=29817 RepID=A0AAX6FM53_IRIPA|nr:putative transcription factor VIP1 [Iris pallida]
MDPNQHRFGPIPPARGHRRAHSESFLRLPDELLLDSDPDFNISDIDFPSLSDENFSAGTPPPPPPPAQSDRPVRQPAGGHGRSMSVDTAFFEGFDVGSGYGGAGHRRSGSVDGFEGDSATSDYAKKAMAADKLAELSLLDPKRAKRILANRQSAARSKERKVRYTGELERKVQTLQTEATTLSAQLTLLQRDTTGLTAENRELKLRLQAMEQQAHLREALNDALKEEVHRLKIATGQIPTMNGNAFNRGLPQSAFPFYSRPPQVPNPNAHQAQQFNAPRSQSQSMSSQSRSQSPSNGQPHGDQSPNDSMDFM